MIALLQFVFRLPQASTVAPDVDRLFDFILWTSIISFIIIVFGKLFFLIRFSRKRVPENQTAYITGHTATELGVAAFLTVLVMVIFYWGWVDYKNMRSAPRGAMEINIVGKQWLWEMHYNNGRTLTNELVVPLGKPVKLIMTSKDVLHSFYVPNFRIKQDLIPNTYTSVWFEATQVGEHQIFCAEYCGAAHSGMLAKVRVLEPDDFEAWEVGYEKGTKPGTEKQKPLAETGKELFAAKGCSACHSVDGKPGLGPSHFKVFGRTEELTTGETITVDENYVRESIMEPNKKTVKGFAPVMPTFQGQLNEEELNALIAYLKSLQ
ncbi:MAG: cytochrome c oxidase subunit II [Deltaproteobacteria bacterium]|nr:cytochrome c oxidase subunit II [Deltaproteobacteria bacterium]